MEKKENTFWKRLKLGVIVGAIGTLGAAFFSYYDNCHQEKKCSFLEMDSLQFDVHHRYRSPCEENFGPLQNGDILCSEGNYKMEFTPQKKENGLIARFLPQKENKYIYIYQIDNSQRIYQLIPTEFSVNQEEQSTPVVRVGTSYSLPVKKIDNNTGGETKIYFLSFKDPNEHLESLYEALENSSPATATHDRSHINLIDAVQLAWEEEDLFTTSVPVMTFKYREKPSCGYKESDHKESELHVEVKYSYRSEGESDFKPLDDNAVLYSGEQYKIKFTPSEDSYVYIFQAKIDNQQHKDIYTLFPCSEYVRIGNNPVSANTTYYLPNENNPKYWILDDQVVDLEKIYFLAFKTNRDLKPEYQQIDQACKQPNSHNWVLKSLNWRNEGIFSNILTFKHEDRKN